MLHYFTQLKVWLGVALFASLTCAPAAFGQLENPGGEAISVVKYTLDWPVTEKVPNQCNGENVILNGTMHFEYFFLTDADGDHTHYNITSTSNLTGVGQTTGASYVAHESTVYNSTTHQNSSSDLTMTTKSKLVAQGKTPDMMLRTLTHVVVDAFGHIKADVIKNNVTCK
jgi:hypothetical protein